MLKFYSILLFIVFAVSGCDSAVSNNQNNNITQNSVITHEITIQKSELLKSSSILSNTNYYKAYTSDSGPMVTQMSAEFYGGDLCQNSTIVEKINLNFTPIYFNNPLPAPSITFCKLYSNSSGTGCGQLFNDTVVSKKIKSIRINYSFNNGKSFAGTCLYNNNVGYETFADFSDPNNPKACSESNGEWQKCSLSQSYTTTFIYSPSIQLLKTRQTSSLPFSATLYSDGNLQNGILEDPSLVRFTTETKNGTTCIIDNLTGLEWPQDWSVLKKSAWSPTPTNVNICGYTDWRTPTQNEIMSLFNFSQANNITNWLSVIGFINIPFGNDFSSGNIWTAEEYQPNLNSAWLTNLAHSGNYYMDKNDANNYIIPVRNYNTKYLPPISTQPNSGGYGTPWPTKRFTPPQDYSGKDECLTDSMTQLTWTSDLSTTVSSIDFNQKYTLDNAISNAATLNNNHYCGYNDWRLPTIYELSLLVNYNTGNISVGAWLESQGFKFGDLYNNEFFWSSSSLPSSPNNHFIISMFDGYYIALNNAPPITARNIFVHGPVTTFNTSNRFTSETINGQTCIIDNTTGEEWPQDWNAFDQGTAISFDNALKDFTLEQQKSYCGHNDWHIPSVNELNSLINYLAPNPSAWLNANGFQNVSSGSAAIATYWSSTSYSFNNLNYWAPNFIAPQNYYFPKTSQHGFIMARSYDDNISQGAPASTQSVGGSGIAWPKNRFVTTTDNTECVNDMLTGLMWIKDLNTIGDGKNPVNWQTAINNIDNANKGYGYCGYHDWRLPNITELRSLINYGDISPAGWLNNNKFILNIQPTFFWTSTTSSWDNNLAYFLSFSDGYFWINDKNGSALVMPVRGGLSKGTTKQPQSCQMKKNPDGSYKLPGGDWQSFHLSPTEQFYKGETFPCHDTKYDGTTIETTCPTEEGHEMGRFIVGEKTSSAKVSSCGTCSIVEGEYLRSTDEVTYKIVCSEPQ